MKSKTVKEQFIQTLPLRASVAIDPEESKVYVGTTTGEIDKVTVKIFCEGIIRCMENYYYSPKRMQKELDDIKKYIWHGVLDQYPGTKRIINGHKRNRKRNGSN